MSSAGWTLAAGQPVMRTVPPVTTAAARNGTAFDRSGSISQCRAATGARPHLPAVGVESSTSTPAWRSIATVIAMCGADGSDAPVWCTVRPSVNDGRAQQQAGDELRRGRGVDVHRPAGDRSGAAHPERQPVAVDVDAEPAQRVQQRRDRPGPGLLVAVERRPSTAAQRRQRRDEPQHRAGQAAVDSRRRRPGRSRPLTVSSRPSPVDPQAQRPSARRSSGRCRGCAARR